MMEITGKYNSAKIFTDVVDQPSIDQVKLLCDQEFTSGSKIRMMPDIHAGAGCTIGTSMTIKDKIAPNLVGVDISCGMEVVQIDTKEIDFERLDKVIHKVIPCGRNIRNKPHKFSNNIDLSELKCYQKINKQYAIRSIGTLGGGNHFIEIDKDDDGNFYLVIHSGSRHLGLEVSNYYQDLGYLKLNNLDGSAIKELITTLKAEGRKKEIQSEIEKFKSENHTSPIPKDLCYVEGEDFENYIHDMKIMSKFAKLNREAIAHDIAVGMRWSEVDKFTTTHNYIDTENMILRKGAVDASLGKRLLIPINMRDGSLICIGKGNPDWNYSAPHGAGRLLSRAEASKTVNLEDFTNTMKDVYSTTVNEFTKDESPFAYKPIESILENIVDTVDVVKRIKSVYNFKADN